MYMHTVDRSTSEEHENLEAKQQREYTQREKKIVKTWTQKLLYMRKFFSSLTLSWSSSSSFAVRVCVCVCLYAWNTALKRSCEWINSMKMLCVFFFSFSVFFSLWLAYSLTLFQFTTVQLEFYTSFSSYFIILFSLFLHSSDVCFR